MLRILSTRCRLQCISEETLSVISLHIILLFSRPSEAWDLTACKPMAPARPFCSSGSGNSNNSNVFAFISVWSQKFNELTGLQSKETPIAPAKEAGQADKDLQQTDEPQNYVEPKLELAVYQEEVLLARRQLCSDTSVTNIQDIAVDLRRSTHTVRNAFTTLQSLQRVSALASSMVVKDSSQPTGSVTTEKTKLSAHSPLAASDLFGCATVPPSKSASDSRLSQPENETAAACAGSNRPTKVDTAISKPGADFENTAGELAGTGAMATQLAKALRATAAVARMLQSAADKASDIVKKGEAQSTLTQVEGWQEVLDAAAELGKAADAVQRVVQLGEDALAQFGSKAATPIIVKIAKERQHPRDETEVKAEVAYSVQVAAVTDATVSMVGKAVQAVKSAAVAVADVPLGGPGAERALKKVAEASAAMKTASKKAALLEVASNSATRMHEVALILSRARGGAMRAAVEAWKHAGAEAAKQMKASTVAAVSSAVAMGDPEKQKSASKKGGKSSDKYKAPTQVVEKFVAAREAAAQAAAVWQYTAVVAAAVQGVGEAAEAAAVRVAPAAVALAAARLREANSTIAPIGLALQAMEDTAAAMEASTLAQMLGPIEAAAMLGSRTQSGHVEELGAAADASEPTNLQVPAASKDGGNGGGNDAVAHVDPRTPGPTASTAPCGSHAAELAALAVANAAEQEVRALLSLHAKGLNTARGLVFEVHHAASFNLDAIRRGSGLRAERWEDGADIRIYDRIYAWATLARAQLKTARGGMGQSKYKGMQKVVPADVKLCSQTSHVLSCGGVSSRPLTAAALADVVQDPAAHFRGLLWWEPSARQLGLLAGK